MPLKERVVGNVRQSLVLLLGAVGLVLLIGCVNVANLLLARASVRGREMAIRRALGAAQGRLTRQLLTESLLLSLFGGIAGVAILFLLKDFLLRLVPEDLPHLNEISISWNILLFVLVASVVSGVLFGLAPALQASRLDLNHALKREGRSTGSRERARTRRGLVITQFALSLVLMIAAGLLLRSFWDLLNVQLGFNPRSDERSHKIALPKRFEHRQIWDGFAGSNVRSRTDPPMQNVVRCRRSSDRRHGVYSVDGRGTRGNPVNAWPFVQ